MYFTKNVVLNWYSSVKKKIRKIRMIFDIENWLWKSDLGTFWRPLWTSVKVKSKKYFYFTDFFAKIKPLLTHVRKSPPLRSRYSLTWVKQTREVRWRRKNNRENGPRFHSVCCCCRRSLTCERTGGSKQTKQRMRRREGQWGQNSLGIAKDFTIYFLYFCLSLCLRWMFKSISGNECDFMIFLASIGRHTLGWA